MANKKPRPVLSGEKTPALLLVIAGIFVLLGGWLMWRHFIFADPSNTFWGMVDASLQTEGVTKYVSQGDDAGYGEQYLQLELGATNAARSLTTLVETDTSGQGSKVVTETIGTPEANYVQYRQIESTATLPSGESPDFAKVLNIWGKEDLASSGLGQGVFSEAILGVVPFGRLTPAQRAELIQFMKDNQVYSVDYKNATRIEHEGKAAYQYQVQIKPDAYIAMLKKFDAMMGLNQLNGLDETRYQLSAPIELQMTVAIDARQLSEVSYIQAGRVETFTGYGANANIQIPTEYITRQELEQQLSKLVQ